MGDKFRLKKLEINGFRGFPKKRIFDLSKPFILLSGPNGTGKSSVLTAIEWCIYGDLVAKINRTEIRERKNWEIVNKRSSEAVINLLLESDEETVTLTRSSKGAFVLKLKDDTQIKNRGKIWSFLGAELEDFFASIHLHQEAIRDLIISTPKKRRESFYRLLGLSDMQNILDAISSSITYLNHEIMDKFNSRYLNLETRLETKWKDLIKRKREEKKRGVKFGLSGEDFSPAKAKKLAKKISQDIQKLAKEFRLSIPAEWEEMNSVGKREIFFEKVRQQIRKLRNQNPSTVKLNKLRDEKAKLEGYKRTFDNLEKERRDGLNRLEKLKTNDCLAQLNQEKQPQKILKDLQLLQKTTEEKLKKTKETLRSSNILAGLITDGLHFIQIRGKISFCPICGQTTDKSRIEKHLQSKKAEMGARKARFSDKIAALEAKLGELKEVGNKLKDLISEREHLSGRKEKGIKKLVEVFGLEIGPYEEPAKMVEKRIDKLDLEMKKTHKAVSRFNENFDSLEDMVQQLKVIDDVLKLDEKIDQLGRISQNPALKKVRGIRIKAYQLTKELGVLEEILKIFLREEASDKLETVREEIEGIFKKLTSRQYFPNLVVDPADFEVWAKDARDRSAAATFYNQGDMNQAALSIFFGLAKQQNKSHRLEFMILDDPSQSLGTDYKNSLAKLINDEVCSHSQVVISTMDKEFEEALDKHILKKKKVFNFEGWDPLEGPEVTIID